MSNFEKAALDVSAERILFYSQVGLIPSARSRVRGSGAF